MKLHSSTCLAVVCLLMTAQAAFSQAPSKMTSAEEEVRRMNTAEIEAFLHRDAAAMAGIWSDDMVVTNPFNKLVTKNDVLGMMKSEFLVITSYDRRIEYLHDYGDSVVVAGGETVVWGGKMPLAGKTQQLRFTAVWRKQNGAWKEVVRHANILP